MDLESLRTSQTLDLVISSGFTGKTCVPKGSEDARNP